jgi:cytochrome c biogenesis protein CcdA
MRYFKSLTLIALGLSILLSGNSFADDAQVKYSGVPKLMIFYSPACYHCSKVRTEYMPRIEAKYNGIVEVEYFNLDDINNYKLLLGLEEKYSPGKKALPILFMRGRFLEEEVRFPGQIEYFIEEGLGRVPSAEGAPGQIDLIARFNSLPLMAIMLAGSIDGINPCAFTVIVFFVAFLTAQKYRKREVVAVGLSFILAVFLAYFLMGLGAFRVLYAFKGIFIVKKIVYGLSALMCFILFIFSLYDIFKFKKTGNTEEMTLRLPDRVKVLIHRVIGRYYRKTGEEPADRGARGVVWLVLSAISCGFLVSALEAVCTGQLYLPTIAFVLKTSSQKAQALFYLVMYNIMFTIPLLLIFILALLGVSSGRFAQFLRRNLVAVKALLAVVFLALGIMLFTGM